MFMFTNDRLQTMDLSDLMKDEIFGIECESEGQLKYVLDNLPKKEEFKDLTNQSEFNDKTKFVVIDSGEVSYVGPSDITFLVLRRTNKNIVHWLNFCVYMKKLQSQAGDEKDET